MFHIVDFTAQLPKERTVVPTIWLSKKNTLCALPPLVTPMELDDLARKCTEPDVGWQIYGVRCMQSFDTYSQAKESLWKSKENTESENGSRRKRRKPSYLVNYTALDSDDGQAVLPDTSNNSSVTIKEELEYDESSDTDYRPAIVLTALSYNDQSSSGTTTGAQNDTQTTSQFPLSWPQTTEINAHCACNSSCHKAILQLLLSIQKQIQLNTRMLQQLLGQQQVHPTPSHQSLPKNFPVSLPANEMESLEVMDVFLQDETKFAQTLAHFSSLGGNDFKQTMRRLLEKLISTELAQQLNWKGRGEKKPFQTFQRIHNLMYHAAKHNPRCDGITLTDVEKFIKDWLRFAPDRYGGRLKRKLEAQEKILKDVIDPGA